MNPNTRTALIFGAVALALLIAVPLLWGGLSGWQGGWGMGPGMMGGFGAMGGLMMIPMVLFWGLIMWGIVAWTRGAWGGYGADSHSGHMDSALDVLKRRYAQGEIGKEEYEGKKRDLA